MTVTDIVIEDQRWTQIAFEGLAETAARAVLDHHGLGAKTWEVAILACDDSKIAQLNADFRGKNAATNVLSWPSSERGATIDGKPPSLPDPVHDAELGDIAISWDTTEREAIAANIPITDHATHLVVHSMLHLLGYDHESDADGDLMEAVEIAILSKLGIADPYKAGNAKITNLER